MATHYLTYSTDIELDLPWASPVYDIEIDYHYDTNATDPTWGMPVSPIEIVFIRYRNAANPANRFITMPDELVKFLGLQNPELFDILEDVAKDQLY